MKALELIYVHADAIGWTLVGLLLGLAFMVLLDHLLPHRTHGKQ